MRFTHNNSSIFNSAFFTIYIIFKKKLELSLVIFALPAHFIYTVSISIFIFINEFNVLKSNTMLPGVRKTDVKVPLGDPFLLVQ
jgi:hypothetical protein